MPKQPYFTADGKEVPSVTTITGKYKNMGGLLHYYWKEGREGREFNKSRDKAGDIGTALHHMISCYIMMQEHDFEILEGVKDDMPMVHILFDKFKRWWDTQKVGEVVCAEKMLVSEHHGYGGTPDLVAWDANGTAVLFDWKTSSDFYQEMLMQGAAYCQLVGEVTGLIVDTAKFILIAKDRPKLGVYSISAPEMTQAFDKFKLLRAVYELEEPLDSTVKGIRKNAVRYDYSQQQGSPGPAKAGA